MSDRMVSGAEVHMNQRGETEFLCEEKNSHVDIHCCLLNIYGDQMMNVTEGRRVVRFSSGNSNTKVT